MFRLREGKIKMAEEKKKEQPKAETDANELFRAVCELTSKVEKMQETLEILVKQGAIKHWRKDGLGKEKDLRNV